MEIHHKNVSDAIKAWLPVVVLIVTMAVAWGALKAEMQYHETRICTLEETTRAATAETTLAIRRIEVSLARIETELVQIRRELDKK